MKWMKSVKRTLAVILVLAAVAGSLLSAAGAREGTAGAQAPVVLKQELWGDKPNQWDAVVAEFERRTADTLNIKLDTTFTPLADYAGRLKLKLAAGEQVDLVFDAQWINMNEFIPQGNYYALDEYFFNDDFPGLKASFDEAYLNNNKFFGKIYGVPFTRAFGGLPVTFIRKDLREKYGLGPIEDLDDLEAFYDAVLANETGMIPFAKNGDGHYGNPVLFNEERWNPWTRNIWTIALGGNTGAAVQVALSDDNRNVTAIALGGEPPEAFAGFPAPFNEVVFDDALNFRRWYELGYVEKDVIAQNDAQALFTVGKAASLTWTMSQWDQLSAALSSAVPGAEMEIFVPEKPKREMWEATNESTFQAWNFACVPITSKNRESAMKFLDWIFSSRENHDLFEYGIKGVHWEAVGEDQYRFPAGVDMASNYNFPGYQLTWNPNYIRYLDNLPQEIVDYNNYIGKTSTYFRSAVAGFNPDIEPIRTALANPDLPKLADEVPVTLGVVADPIAYKEGLWSKIRSNTRLQNDIGRIKAEIVKQLEAFLADR